MLKATNRRFLYSVNDLNKYAVSHCHKPTPIIIDDEKIRVFFGVRSKKNITTTTFVDLNARDVFKLSVEYEHSCPVLQEGVMGAFDDCGANVCSIVAVGNLLYMYYIGWNPSTTVHTRNSIGLVISEDRGLTFKRLWHGPILDRNRIEPFYTGAVDVKRENDIWRMWYTSGTGWRLVDEKPEIQYHIKYAESKDGIEWDRKNINCIENVDDYEAVARPSVFISDNTYRMLYSKRRLTNFRNDPQNGYRAGYATSFDGINWSRKDIDIDFLPSEKGWDSEAVAYPYVINFKTKNICFYNGNGFGKTGFGYSILEEE